MLENQDQLDNSSTENTKVETDTKTTIDTVSEDTIETSPEKNLKETTVDDSKTSESKDVEAAKIIKMEDYDKFSIEELTSAIKNLINEEAVQKIVSNVNAIKTSFNHKFKEFISAKKEEFVAEGGNEIDFHFKSDVKYAFNGFVNDYKKKIKSYYKQKEDERNDNFNKKLALIEELKALITSSESSTMYKDFKALQEKWHHIGPVPREKNEDTWQTYRHYEQQVYDLLHLNSDFRNLDFKHNLEEKTKIVERAEQLSEEDDNNKAFKELQILHRLWKEEIGPVAREFRDDIWNRFSEATKKIHDKRQEFFDSLEEKYKENIPKKEAVIEKIKTIISEEITSHNIWQNKIKEFEALRNEFFKIGKVTKEKSDELWETFREATKNFNQQKNNFYKSIKKEQQANLDKKKELVDKANSLKDSEDLDATTEIYKKIQAEWKTIGHVPRKFSDKIWKEFRAACNHFFDRLHNIQDEANKELLVVFEQKKEYLEKLKNDISEDVKVTIDDVKKYINEWKGFGKVPSNMRFIESKFNKVIDKLFSSLDMDKRDSAMLRFKNSIDSLMEQNDTRKIENEMYFIRKKIDETTKELKLLENNLGFFSNVSPDNPMVKGVYKNIEKHQSELDLWKKKLIYLNGLEF
jgi:hypothetical protein